MKWLIVFIISVLILGPLRRPFFRNWRFTVPAFLWGYLSFEIASRSGSRGEPWWFPVVIALFVALGAGAAGKEWLDGVFGKGT